MRRAIAGASTGSMPPSMKSSPESRTPTGKPADLGADRGEDLDEEPRPVLRRAAVLVLAQVGGRRQELADEVAVGAVQLDAVEPARLDAPGGGGERGDGVVDHRRGHRRAASR